MDNETSTIYIISNSETNHLFESVGKVVVGSAIGYLTVCGIKRVAKTDKVRNLIDRIKSR